MKRFLRNQSIQYVVNDVQYQSLHFCSQNQIQLSSLTEQYDNTILEILLCSLDVLSHFAGSSIVKVLPPYDAVLEYDKVEHYMSTALSTYKCNTDFSHLPSSWASYFS